KPVVLDASGRHHQRSVRAYFAPAILVLKKPCPRAFQYHRLTSIPVICPWCRPSAFRPRSFSSPQDRDWLCPWSELSWPAGFRLEWKSVPAASLPVSLRSRSAATSFERSPPAHSIEARLT